MELNKKLAKVCEISKNIIKSKPFSSRPDICVSICLATAQSICWGKEGTSLIELGVRDGKGLSFIIKVCKYLTNRIGTKYNIYGFDTFEGMPKLEGFEDHNEIWEEGQYKPIISYEKMVENFRDKVTADGTNTTIISAGAILIKGDVKDTVTNFLDNLDIEYPIGFISLDLDLYSSTKSGLKILEDVNSNKYVPTVLMIVDDQDFLLTYNDWCGEALAIREFNDSNKMRKIQNRKEIYQRMRFVHILDHGLRTGEEKPEYSFEIKLKRFIKFTERAMI